MYTVNLIDSVQEQSFILHKILYSKFSSSKVKVTNYEPVSVKGCVLCYLVSRPGLVLWRFALFAYVDLQFHR
jgi:hypothetical protein